MSEDIGLKMGSKREAYWQNIKNKCEEAILNSEEGLVIDRKLLEMANKAIEEEKEKLK